jgi:predicted porin
LKKTAIAIAVCGACTVTAHAQSSVTLYGIIDAGVVTQSNANATGGRATSFQDAQILPSIYGMKGSEDLGGGLTAGFTLEGGFNSGNGVHNSPGVYQSQIFGREAKVSLSGDWGSVGAGMQVDPALIASISTEPRGLADSFSMLEYWIGATLYNGGGLAATASGSLTGGIFDVNSLTYTYAKNGLYVGLEYGFGGIAGSNSAGQTESIGVSYAYGGFLVSGGYAKSNTIDPTGVTDGASEITDFGLGYDFGNVALRGQYAEFKASVGLFGGEGSNYSNDVQTWGIGADLKTGVTNKINLSYYDAKDKGAGFGGKTTEVALMDILSLSKRTQVFAQAADVKADPNAGMSAMIGGVYASNNLVAFPGSTVFFGVGVQHSF